MTNEPFLHQLMSLPTIGEARLSPDKRWVAFTWYRVHENYDVFLVPSDGSQTPVALTHTPEETQLVSWTPDSKAVIVAEDHDGDELARLFRIEINQPQVMQPLTEDRPVYFIRGGMLHPNGRHLFYGANYDFAQNRLIEPTWVYRHDLVSGARVPIACPSVAMWTEPALNRTGTHLIYPRRERHPAGRQYWLAGVDGDGDREILNFGEQVKLDADWHPDSEHIVFLSESTGDGSMDHFSLGVYHWPTNRSRWLIDDPGRLLEGVWVTRDGLVVVDEMENASHKPSYLDISSGKETPFTKVAGNLLPIGQSVDGSWLGLHYSATSPNDLVRLPPDGQQSSSLLSLTRVWEHTELTQDQLCLAENYHWKSRDGLQVQGWVYRATPNRGRAILYIHGGPNSHSESRLNPQIQYYVRRGFNVLDVNYRGSTGFGVKYRNAIRADGWGGGEQADITSGAEALMREGLAEPGKIGVTGTSFGGYCAWFQITYVPPEIIAAAAPICGMTDLVVDYNTTRPDLRPLSEEMMGGRPDQVPERYYERSPIHFVKDIRGKLLIVQGALDPNVSPENVRQVREQLELHQVPYELLVFEDEGHGIIKPANQARLYTQLADFFEQAFEG